MSDSSPTSFLEVLGDEHSEIVRRRRAVGLTMLDIPNGGEPVEGRDRARCDGGWTRGAAVSDRSNVGARSRPEDENGHADDSTGSGEPDRASSHSGPIATVGLALSGGGMRSASIGLGLLQSLYRRGILRHVDYFSTVSGGGYSGALLSSSVLAEQNREKQIDWGPRDAFNPSNQHRKRLDFDAAPNGPQPGLVCRIARMGESLRRPLMFASRWFWGFLVISIFVVSGLLAATSFAAWLFRLLDGRESIIYLQQLGFRTDLSRAFLPAFVMLIAWLIAQVIFACLRRSRSRVPDFPARVFLLFVVSVVLAVTALFATKDISLVSLQEVFGWTEEATQFLDGAIRWLGRGAAALFAFSILPLLTPASLLRSGTRPRKPWHRWAFNFASYGVVFGIPLVLFFLLSKENISDYNQSRPNQFTFSEIQIDQANLSRFWGAVAADQLVAESPGPVDTMPLGGGPSYRIWSVVRDAGAPKGTGRVGEGSQANIQALDREDLTVRRILEVQRALDNDPDSAAPGEGKHSAALLLTLQGQINDKDRETWFFQRWSRFVFEQFGISQEFGDNLADRRRFWHLRREINSSINDECLSDPWFYMEFAELEQDTAAPIGDSVALVDRDSSPSSLSPGTIRYDKRFDELTVPEWYANRYGGTTSFRHLWNRAAAHEENLRGSLGFKERFGESAPTPRVEIDDARSDSQATGATETDEQDAVGLNQTAKLPGVSGRAPTDGDAGKSLGPTEGSRSTSYKAAPTASQARRSWLLREVTRLRDEISDLEAERPTVPEFGEERFHERLQQLYRERDEYERRLTAIREANWAMLEAYYNAQGITIRPPETVFAVNVNPVDQQTRLKTSLISLLVFLLVGLIVPVNPTTLHTFYRDQIASVWTIEDARTSGRRIPLKQLDTCRSGGPYHIINGALNLFGGRNDREQDGTARFSFTQLYCGADRVGYRPTGLYAGGHLDLANAAAISGGAVTPGRIDNVLVRTLLYLLNFRLGQWLPNPSNPPSDVSWPSMLGLLMSHLARGTEERNYCFVSDGGHDENTGIGALLQRRCRVIVACDASEDGDYDFHDFQRLHQDAVNKHGVRIVNLETHEIPDDPDQLDFDDLIPPSKRKQPGNSVAGQAEHHSRSCYVIARIIYPDDELTKAAGLAGGEPQRTGYLIYVKPTLTGGEPAFVKNFSATNPEFPHDTTLDQFFKEDRFWVYRALGDRMGEVVYNENFKELSEAAAPGHPWLSVWVPARVARETPIDVRQRVSQLLEGSALLATRIEHARRTRNADEEQDMLASETKLLAELEQLGGETIDAAEEVLHAIAVDHPWELALRALIRDDPAGWGDRALRTCALYATNPSLCLRFTDSDERQRIALAASEMLMGLVVDKPLDGSSKRRLCEAVTRDDLCENLRVNLVDALFRISEHHPRYRPEVERVLERIRDEEGAGKPLKQRAKRALGWLQR